MIPVTPAEIDADEPRPDMDLDRFELADAIDDDASHAEEQRRHAVTLHDMCGPDEAWA